MVNITESDGAISSGVSIHQNQQQQQQQSIRTSSTEKAVCPENVDTPRTTTLTKKARIYQICIDFFFHILLGIIYCIYAAWRYYQYTCNRIKIKILNLAYNPSNTPQLIRRDVNALSKIPKRLAAIMEYKSEEDVGGGILGLMEQSSDLVAWTLSAGIKQLILYDYNGVLKSDINLLRQTVFNKLIKYYGPNNAPKYVIRIPRTESVYYNTTTEEDNDEEEEEEEEKDSNKKVSIEIILLSNVDGRETIVELTKTMAELCCKNEVKLEDISMELVDKELIQLVGHEPDLLLYFGPNLDLQGYPPWHIRLTELYWEPDNDDVSYSVFIRGLKKYSTCKVNVGK